MLMLNDPNESSQDDMNKFWASFTSWYDQSAIVADYFKAEYTDYDNWNGGTYFLNIDFEQEYKIHYGISYPQSAIEEYRWRNYKILWKSCTQDG